MTDSAALPLVAVLGIVTVLLVRAREASWWAAILVFLFGVYTGLTPVVFTITDLVQWLIDRFTS